MTIVSNLDILKIKETAYQNLIRQYYKPEDYTLPELLIIIQNEINETVEASVLNHFSKANEIVILQSLLTISHFCESGLSAVHGNEDLFQQLKTSIEAKTDHLKENVIEEE